MSRSNSFRIALFTGPTAAVLLVAGIACEPERPTEGGTAAADESAPVSVTADPSEAQRANRTLRTADGPGMPYELSFQPDWTTRIAVTRTVDGEAVTRTLYELEGKPTQRPGDRIRTRIAAPEHGIDVAVLLEDPRHTVKSVALEVEDPETGETLVYEIEDRAGPPNGGETCDTCSTSGTETP